MIIFIHLPRTAGTFLSNMAKDIIGFNSTPITHQRAINLKTDKYTIGVIRNPFDWYVSRYEYFKQSRPDMIIEKGVSSCNDAGLSTNLYSEKFKTLKDSIYYYINEPPYTCEKCGYMHNQSNRFWLSDMYKYMFCDNNNNLLINQVIKLENLYDELEKIIQKIQYKHNK